MSATDRAQVIFDPLPVPGRDFALPRFIIRGTDGPTLTVAAGQHGRELNGIESLRRLIERAPALQLRGTLQVLPVLNPPGVRALHQSVPGEPHNPNRVWPGDLAGSTAQRMAAAAAPAVAESDYLIDLHGWSDWTVCCTLVSAPPGAADDTPELALGRAFGLPCMYVHRGEVQAGRLPTYATDCGALAFAVELTPQRRLSEHSVQAGQRGVLNVMKHVGMLDGAPELPECQWIYDENTERADLTAESAGLWCRDAEPGAGVAEGELLGRLYSLATMELVQEVRSPLAGLLVNTGPCRADGTESNSVEAGAMLAQVWKARRLTDT